MELSLYTAGFEQVFNVNMILLILLGTTLGVLTGSLPGLTATMGVSILVPVTYSMTPEAGILMLVGIYLGGVFGGAISATLVNIPGTPSAVMTAMDAYPMAQRGEASRALGIATFSSAFGGIFSVFILVLIAPIIADFALEFTSYEMFSIALFGLTIIAVISAGSMIKGLIAGCLGLILASVGADPILGIPRLTFSSMELFGGVQFIAAMVGLFGVTEVLLNAEKHFNKLNSCKLDVIHFKASKVIPEWTDIKHLWANILRSSTIGVIIGAIPGAGGTIASIVSYGVQTKASKQPDEMGKGSIEGIGAAESANNSCTGGAMTTMLSLGIPGDAVTAILIGAFMIHGLQPGPLLFQNNIDLVSTIFLGMLVSNLFILVIGLGAAKAFAKLLSVPQAILNSAIIAFCFIGSYTIQNSFFDVKVMLFFALLGYAMVKADLPRAPVVLALILGPLMESNLRRALAINQDNFLYFAYSLLERPIAAAVLFITFLAIVSSLFKRSSTVLIEEK